MRLEREPVVDELVIDGETVVLVGESVVLLNAVAGRLLELLSDGARDADDVRARILEEFGAPDDPDAAWQELVADLVSHELLRMIP